MKIEEIEKIKSIEDFLKKVDSREITESEDYNFKKLTYDILEIGDIGSFAGSNLFSEIRHGQLKEKMAFNSKYNKKSSYFGEYVKKLDIYDTSIPFSDRLNELESRKTQMEAFALKCFNESLIE